MPRTVKKERGRGGKTVSAPGLGGKPSKQTGASQMAKVFYKPGRAGRQESDRLHILVPRLYEGSDLVEPLNVSLGQSIHQDPQNEGIVITGVQVGKFEPSTFKGSPRGKGVGQIVFSLRRDPALTTDDVIYAMKNSVFEQSQIRIGEVHIVTRSADLPGNPTGPGPRPRPKTS